jgi:hypothetical protein
MEFFPLTLGLPKPRQARRENAPDHADAGSRSARVRDWKAWHESLSAPQAEMEEVPHAAVLEHLRAGPADRPWVILGEPGAGKTHLLAHWHETWLRSLSSPRLGAPVPVLVRLRELGAEAFRGDPSEVADRLWQQARATGLAAARGHATSATLDLPGRMFTPVWLLDGLDEMEGHPGAPAFWDMLGALPGAVVLTCRTAMFQQVERDVAGRHAPPWRILGLKPGEEQAAYLRLALAAAGGDPARANGLIQALNANPALRPLAASPLLLALVAEISDTLVLPANRAAFYAEATRKLWWRKLKDRPALLSLKVERDAALARLAGAMGVSRIEAEESVLKEIGISGPLRDALRISGLLTFDDQRERVSFPHLTFQEFHFARSWLSLPLRQVLVEHWADPRAEEALGLLLSLHEAAGRGGEVEAVLQTFVTEWRERHEADPSVLWDIGRSPMRVALQLVSRASLALQDPLLGGENGTALFRLAVAYTPGLSAASLDRLARDAEPAVRLRVAVNPDAPLSALGCLASDPAPDVRGAVASNPRTPASSLAVLARDREISVRQNVAGNRRTPTDMLAVLADDSDVLVRRSVAANPGTAPDTLGRLVYDTDMNVRWHLAASERAPPDTLIILASDPDRGVREYVAENVSAPAEALARLASDTDPGVRQRAAEHPVTPRGCLSMLAKDKYRDVRWEVASNNRTRGAVLAALARDNDPFVRWTVAGNLGTPPSALSLLATDQDPDVRARAAETVARLAASEGQPSPSPPRRNRLADQLGRVAPWAVLHGRTYPLARYYDPSIEGRAPDALAVLSRHNDHHVRWGVAVCWEAPPGVLARLAMDVDTSVRSGVAGNPSTPPDVLATLAVDADNSVRWEAARNPATPIEALTALAGDVYTLTRSKVAFNPATSPLVRAALAKDSDEAVRKAVSASPSAAPEALAGLARDSSDDIRRRVARNRSTAREALALLARDTDSEVRSGVAGNPAASPRTLAELAADPDQRIREQVAANPAVLLEDLYGSAVR